MGTTSRGEGRLRTACVDGEGRGVGRRVRSEGRVGMWERCMWPPLKRASMRLQRCEGVWVGVGGGEESVLESVRMSGGYLGRGPGKCPTTRGPPRRRRRGRTRGPTSAAADGGGAADRSLQTKKSIKKIRIGDGVFFLKNGEKGRQHMKLAESLFQFGAHGGWRGRGLCVTWASI